MKFPDHLLVNVKQLLSFYDENRQMQPHSNAIKTLAGEELGFALVIEYFKRVGVTAKLLNRRCNVGSRSGSRLDGWLETTSSSSATITYYQVEVKSWSIHGVGGDCTTLGLASTSDEVVAYKKRLWTSYWSNGSFIEPQLNKVLKRMRADPTWVQVEPLAVVWSAMHPEGKRDEFFSVPLSGHTFPRISVFSMSSFLRNIVQVEPELLLHLPSTAKRIRLLNTLFIPAQMSNVAADVC